MKKTNKTMIITSIIALAIALGVGYFFELQNTQNHTTNTAISINQSGGQTANTINNFDTVPPARQINDQVITSLDNHLPQNKTYTIKVTYLVSDEEAYHFA